MLTTLFPKYHQRYLESPVADWLAGFADWLVSAGYAHDPAHDHVRRLKLVLEARGSVTPDTVFSVAELATMFTSARQQPLLRGTQHAFARFLAAEGRLVVEPDCNRFTPLLDAYRHHLIETRGLATSTISQHLTSARAFLVQAVPADALLQDLTAQAIERFIAAAGQRLRRQSLQHTIAQLRAFLRFCHDRGELHERLDIIDTPRTYRDESPPRALAWGLVQCKTHSLLVLPLSDQALRVLKHYLRCGRPGSAHPQLFLRGRTPAGPIRHTALCDIYEKRAKLSELALRGTSSYSLRHAFAMRLLERGVGIKAIGDLLGHHTLESTCVYLRLQTEALREVGLPLPSLAADGARSVS